MITTNGSHVRKVHEGDARKPQRAPAIANAKAGDFDGALLVQRVRDGIKEHPYASMLATAVLGAGVGLLMSSRVTRAIAVRAGAFAIGEVLQKFIKEAIGASLTVQP